MSDSKDAKAAPTAAAADPFGDALADLMKGAGVTGVLATDKHGLTLGALGTLKGSAPGYWHALYEQHSKAAAAADAKDAHAPVLIETAAGTVLLSQKNGVTLAIARSPAAAAPAASS